MRGTNKAIGMSDPKNSEESEPSMSSTEAKTSSDDTISKDQILEAVEQLQGRIIKTPTVQLSKKRFSSIDEFNEIWMKLELFQYAGSFKTRGVLLAIDQLDEAAKESGVVTVSAGNHALAVATAARLAGVNARLVIPATADPSRVKQCRALGAEIEITSHIAAAFEQGYNLVERQNRTMLHPFESKAMVLGAATCGYELVQNSPELDAVVVPIGGGGLISGIASAFAAFSPNTEIFGVEPYGADTMWRSLEQGECATIDEVKTIAASLGSPYAMPYTFSIVKSLVSQCVRVSDDELTKAMGELFNGLKIAAEPACAAGFAGMVGPLKDRLATKKVGLVACGSNIDFDRYAELCLQG